MKVRSLFTGIGSFDLGFERAGFEIEYQCEIDKHARKVLAQHWPHVRCYEDVRGISGDTSVDVLCGGFPCQDLSVAGKRAGLAGERSGLWFEFHRVIRESRPRTVLIENVPGLLSSNQGRDFAIVLQGLVELGYGVCWRVLDAQYFGVAQRRRRVFIVGSLGDGRAAEILLEPSCLPGDSSTRQRSEETIAGTISGRIARSHTELDGHGAYITSQHIEGVISNGYWDGSDTSPALDVSGLVKRQTMPDKPRFAAVTDGGLVRRLTPTECERLQGFPDGWTAGQADVHRYKQLGNAVAVPVAEWIANRIKSIG